MLTRRSLLTTGLSGFAAFAFRLGQAQAWSQSIRKSSKRMIILWMDGGPSQLETFDPKPGAATGGPTEAIATSVDGLQLSAHLPRIASRADDLSIIRTLTSNEGEHQRAKYLNHTGFSPVAAFPRPDLGSLFSSEHHHGNLPGFVALGSDTYGPAYLGDQHAAFAIQDPAATRRLLMSLRNGRRRFQLLDDLSDGFDQRHQLPQANRRKATVQQVQNLLDTQLTELLDIADAPEEVARYGSGEFSRNLLLARRLIEGGVSCVEVQLGGWDTHQNNFASVARLCRQLDQPWAALIDDLKERNLWDDTLLVWLGDFGRTPTINGRNGRDHFPSVSNAVLAGGSLPGGKVVGTTNALGTKIDERPVSTADLFATILHHFGVAANAEYQTSFGSPTEATNDGKVIAELT